MWIQILSQGQQFFRRGEVNLINSSVPLKHILSTLKTIEGKVNHSHNGKSEHENKQTPLSIWTGALIILSAHCLQLQFDIRNRVENTTSWRQIALCMVLQEPSFCYSASSETDCNHSIYILKCKMSAVFFLRWCRIQWIIRCYFQRLSCCIEDSAFHSQEHSVIECKNSLLTFCEIVCEIVIPCNNISSLKW